MFGSSVDTEASPPLPEIGVLPSSIPSTSRYAMSVALMINMAMVMMVIMMMVMITFNLPLQDRPSILQWWWRIWPYCSDQDIEIGDDEVVEDGDDNDAEPLFLVILGPQVTLTLLYTDTDTVSPSSFFLLPPKITFVWDSFCNGGKLGCLLWAFFLYIITVQKRLLEYNNFHNHIFHLYSGTMQHRRATS